MAYTITLLEGDGTGPEITDATVRVLESTGVPLEWERMPAGEPAIAQYQTPIPEVTLASLRKNRVGLKGPIGTPIGKGFRSVNVALRKELDLFANLRPATYYKGVRSMYPTVDLVIVRENTEDLYAGLEWQVRTPEMEQFRKAAMDISGWKINEDAACSLKIISEAGTRRIVEFAFEYARKNGRRKVTAVHKANIMKFTDGLFLDVAREVATEYTDIEFEDRIVDNMCMQLVQKPELYDVLVLPNLYGDIVSDLCAGLVGGLGVAPSANLGQGMALFEPVHGTAPKHAGLNKINPLAMILSGVMMLRHLGEMDAATRLETAIRAVLAEGKDVTYDLKPAADDPTAVGTSQMADAIIARVQALAPTA